MKNYICRDCGHIFEEGEQAIWEEDRGEWWGQRAWEKMCGCPKCCGDYEEAKECEICHSAHLEEDLFGGICEECIDKNRKNFKTCLNIAMVENNKCNVEINELLASIFSASDIEQILIEHIEKNIQDVDCSKFIDNDLSWFGQYLAEEVRKNENTKG